MQIQCLTSQLKEERRKVKKGHSQGRNSAHVQPSPSACLSSAASTHECRSPDRIHVMLCVLTPPAVDKRSPWNDESELPPAQTDHQQVQAAMRIQAAYRAHRSRIAQSKVTTVAALIMLRCAMCNSSDINGNRMQDNVCGSLQEGPMPLAYKSHGNESSFDGSNLREVTRSCQSNGSVRMVEGYEADLVANTSQCDMADGNACVLGIPNANSRLSDTARSRTSKRMPIEQGPVPLENPDFHGWGNWEDSYSPEQQWEKDSKPCATLLSGPLSSVPSRTRSHACPDSRTSLGRAICQTYSIPLEANILTKKVSDTLEDV